MSYRIINGDSAKELKKFKDNSIDAVITDPPYGIEFLAKEWDQNTGAVEIWSECLRVLKPGGYLLAFSAARTYHILATNIQSVGFEIRDQIMWLYASGFPKAQDIGKAIQRRQGVEKTKKLEMGKPGCATRKSYQGETGFSSTNQETIIPTSPEAQKWAGWKTALKPAHEPICMARKPMKGSTIDNVLKHNVGALNIDATRIPFENEKTDGMKRWTGSNNDTFKNFSPENRTNKDLPQGRALDKVVIGGGSHTPNKSNQPEYTPNEQGRFPSNVIGEVEGYQKFFYCPKVSRKERHRGFEQTGIPTNPSGMYEVDGTGVMYNPDKKDPLSHIPSQFPRSEVPGGEGKKMLNKMVEVNKKDPLSHIKKGDNFGDGLATAGALHKDRDPLSHIPAPFGDVKGCYKDGERFAAVHQKLQDPLSQDINPKDGLPKRICNEGGGDDWNHNPKVAERMNVGNNHPTVKPVALMKYLIKLVAPNGSHILDPFMGSGSTGMAAKELGITFTGIEMDKSYCDIAKRRIDASKADQFNKLFDETIK